MENVGQAADTVGDLIVQSNRDLPALRRMVDHLEQLNNLARSYQDAYPEGGAREWADMVQEVEAARATISGLREQVAQDREVMAHGRDEAAKMLQRTGGADVTTDLAWPNTPADEVVARQQVALLAALRDRDEARAYLRERGNDVLQLRAELNESITAQQQLTEQVDRQNVEIRRLMALVQSERSLRQTAETLKDIMFADGRRQDVEIQNLRSQLQGVQRDLRLKTTQSDERMYALEAMKKKIQELRGSAGQQVLSKVAEELQESERKRQDLAEEISKLKGQLKAVLDDQDKRDLEASAVLKEARASEEKLKKWQAVYSETAAFYDKLVPKAHQIRDRLVKALRNGVRGDEGLRGAVDFLNWSRESFLAVGDLAGWLEAWRTRSPFAGTVSVVGTGPALASGPEVPVPAIADVTEVDKEVAQWRARVDDLVASLRDRGVRDQETLAALAPGAGASDPPVAKPQTSFISPGSAVSLVGGPASGASGSEVDTVRKRSGSVPTAPSKRSCQGSHLGAQKSPRSATVSTSRQKDVTPAIVSAYEAMMATRPWERYQNLPSIFPSERANEAIRLVDDALKAFWLKRGREVFERLFYLKLDPAHDKYGSLDQITGPLEMVLASLKVAEADCAGIQHLSPIAYFCSPRHHWPMLFKAPICLRTMFSAHGGDARAERVVLAYLEESKEWFPKVPALARQQDKMIEWTCDPATTFRYYFQRSTLKSKPQGDLAKYQVHSIDDLKVVCSRAISLVDSNLVVPDRPYDFVDLAFNGLRDPGLQWGEFDVHTQANWVRVDGGPIEPRDDYEERLALASGATIL